MQQCQTTDSPRTPELANKIELQRALPCLSPPSLGPPNLLVQLASNGMTDRNPLGLHSSPPLSWNPFSQHFSAPCWIPPLPILAHPRSTSVPSHPDANHARARRWPGWNDRSPFTAISCIRSANTMHVLVLLLPGSVSRRAAGTQSRTNILYGWLLGIHRKGTAFFSASSRLRESLRGYGCFPAAEVVHRARSPLDEWPSRTSAVRRSASVR